jgi:hypothetical protein
MKQIGMDRRLEWIVQKGALAVALHFAVLGQLEWLQYAITAVVWWTLAAALWLAPGERTPRAPMPVSMPLASVMAFDAAILASMFVAHWYWTAFAYAASCGLAALALVRAAKQ